jgi:hypothetical protein
LIILLADGSSPAQKGCITTTRAYARKTTTMRIE